jgi:predicted  nucleic acid-binding Zn-ribbon protein
MAFDALRRLGFDAESENNTHLEQLLSEFTDKLEAENERLRSDLEAAREDYVKLESEWLQRGERVNKLFLINEKLEAEITRLKERLADSETACQLYRDSIKIHKSRIDKMEEQLKQFVAIEEAK